MHVVAKDRQYRRLRDALDAGLQRSHMPFVSRKVSTVAILAQTSLPKYVLPEKIRLPILTVACLCLECGNVFCNTCANYYKLIPSVNLTRPVRVCRDCFPIVDDHNNNRTVEPVAPLTSKSAASMPIQTSCRQPNGTPNGSFNSPGGQKVKG